MAATPECEIDAVETSAGEREREALAAERRRVEGLPAVVLLIALSAIAPLSVDMFLPSLPTIASAFSARDATVQLTVTLFLVSFAGSQLFYGPASDRYGRRPLLVVGLGLFTLGGVLALAARSVVVLIAARVLQGLGGGAGPALSSAIVLDVYGRERAGRMLAYMAMALPVAPAVAPVIGGVLHDYLGWHSVFVTLTVLGVLLLGAYRALLPETHRPGDRKAALSSFAADYRTVLSSRTYVAYVLVMGLMFSGQLVFISTSSFVLIDELGLDAGVFGLSFGFVALGLMAGATLSSRLVRSWQLHRVVLLGATTSTLAGAVMAGLAWAGVAHVASVLAPMLVVAVGLGITRPAAMAGALVPFPEVAGLASALMGFTQLLIASSFNIVFSTLVGASLLALATGVFAPVSAGLLAVVVLRPVSR